MTSPAKLEALQRLSSGAGALLGAWEVAPDGCAVTDGIGRHVATAANPEVARWITATQPRVLRGYIDEIKRLRREVRKLKKGQRDE